MLKISSNITKITDKKVDYIENKGLDNAYYMDYIMTYMKKFGSASKQEINGLIKPKLSSNLNGKQLNNKGALSFGKIV